MQCKMQWVVQCVSKPDCVFDCSWMHHFLQSKGWVCLCMCGTNSVPLAAMTEELRLGVAPSCKAYYTRNACVSPVFGVIALPCVAKRQEQLRSLCVDSVDVVVESPKLGEMCMWCGSLRLACPGFTSVAFPIPLLMTAPNRRCAVGVSTRRPTLDWALSRHQQQQTSKPYPRWWRHVSG